MASKTMTTAQNILDNVGGPQNISSLTHCATRLRFQLRDQSKANQEAIDNDPNVLGVVPQGTTGLQIIMGGDVAEYYQAMTRLDGMDKVGTDEEKPRGPKVGADGKKEYGGVRGKFSWVDYCFEFLSDTFRPVLWALLGASLIITILVLLDTFGVQDFRQPMAEQPPTFQFMHSMWHSVFYFLPIFVGATAAKKLGANEWIGAAIPAAFFTPEYLGMMDTAEKIPTAVEGKYTLVQHVFGLPMVIQDYGGQVFPPIFAAIILLWVEKGLKKIIPSAVHMVFVPFFSLLIMIPLTAFVVGPLGVGLGNGIAHMLFAINNFSPFILAIIVPLLYPFLVPLGLHWPLNAIMIVNINTLGYDFIQGPMGAWNFACFGVITGVMILSMREHNNSMRQVAAGGMFAGLLGGISEPSLYGVLLRYRKSYLRLLPGCFIGGVVMGIFNVKAYAFVFTSLLTVGAMRPTGGYALGIAAAFFTSLFLTLFMDYRTPQEKADMLARVAAENDTPEAKAAATEAAEAAVETEGSGVSTAVTAGGTAAGTAVATAPAPAKAEAPSEAPAAAPAQVKPAFEPNAVTHVTAPLEGRAIALSEVPDQAFASGALGQGIAIEPTGNTVVAPAAGKVLTIQKTGHAVGLRLDSGIDLLIHIGIDTVKMEGQGFTNHVEKKQRVEAGDPLITFDTDAIKAAGYPSVTMVLVSNTKKFASVVGEPAEHAGFGDEVITTTAKS